MDSKSNVRKVASPTSDVAGEACIAIISLKSIFSEMTPAHIYRKWNGTSIDKDMGANPRPSFM
jgi:hypothetical protein